MNKIEPLKEAWLDRVPSTKYYESQQDRLRREWPELATAIEHLIKEDTVSLTNREKAARLLNGMIPEIDEDKAEKIVELLADFDLLRNTTATKR